MFIDSSDDQTVIGGFELISCESGHHIDRSLEAFVFDHWILVDHVSGFD
jgi:hypothetical protein